MYGKMRAVTVTVLHPKKKKEYVCQVYPSFKLVLIFDCKEKQEVQEKIKKTARWAARNKFPKSSIRV